MLTILDKSLQEANLSQPLHTNKKHFKIAITFLKGHNGKFSVTERNNFIYLAKSITDKDGFLQISLKAGAYENESRAVLSKKVILLKQIVHSQSNQVFQHLDLL